MFSASSSDADDDDDKKKAPPTKSFSVVAAAAKAIAAKAKSKSKSKHQYTEAEITAALEDPSNTARGEKPAVSVRGSSRYIGKLVQRAEERQEEARLVEDRRLALEAPEGEKFITPAYARKLAGEASTPTPAPAASKRKTNLNNSQIISEPPTKRTRTSSRFDDAKPPKPLRGLRRNDEASISVYRERYFERERQRVLQRQKRAT